jgi:hypothetical protein
VSGARHTRWSCSAQRRTHSITCSHQGDRAADIRERRSAGHAVKGPTGLRLIFCRTVVVTYPPRVRCADGPPRPTPRNQNARVRRRGHQSERAAAGHHAALPARTAIQPATNPTAGGSIWSRMHPSRVSHQRLTIRRPDRREEDLGEPGVFDASSRTRSATRLFRAPSGRAARRWS